MSISDDFISMLAIFLKMFLFYSDFVFIYLLFLSTHRFVVLDISPDLGWNIPVDKDQTDRSWPARDLQLDLR